MSDPDWKPRVCLQSWPPEHPALLSGGSRGSLWPVRGWLGCGASTRMGASPGERRSPCLLALPGLSLPLTPPQGPLSLPLGSQSILSLPGLGPRWAQLHINSRLFPTSGLAKRVSYKTALCPFSFFFKKCVFDQFYNKTQTEFLKTTAMRNKKRKNSQLQEVLTPAPSSPAQAAALVPFPLSPKTLLPPIHAQFLVPSLLNIP